MCDTHTWLHVSAPTICLIFHLFFLNQFCYNLALLSTRSCQMPVISLLILSRANIYFFFVSCPDRQEGPHNLLLDGKRGVGGTQFLEELKEF